MTYSSQRKRVANELAEKFHWTTANDWKIQSAAKSEQALSLYKSRLYEDALGLAHQAIKQDPANLQAVYVAAACFQAQNRATEAKHYFEKQISLLNIKESAASPESFAWTFDCLPDDEVILEMFSKALKSSLEMWNSSSSSVAMRMTGCLIHRQKLDDALAVEYWLLAIGMPLLEILAVTRALIEKLVTSHRSNEANVLLDSFGNRARSFVDYCCLLELGNLLGLDLIQKLDVFIQTQTINSRRTLESEINVLQKAAEQGRMNRETLTRTMNLVAAKYTYWRRELESQILYFAMTKSKSQAVIGHGCLASIIAWVLLFFITVSGGAALGIRSVPVNRLFLGIAIGATLMGILSAQLIKELKRARNITIFMQDAVKVENDMFWRLGLPMIAPPRPSPLSPAGFALIGMIVLIFWITVWLILNG